MKIIEKLGENIYKVEFDEKDIEARDLYAREGSVTIMHDYVRFKGSMSLKDEDGSVKDQFASEVTIPISSMINIVLPKLTSSQEFQPDKLDQEAYNRLDEVIIDGDNTYFKPAGEREFMCIKTKIYYKYIRPSMTE